MSRGVDAAETEVAVQVQALPYKKLQLSRGVDAAETKISPPAGC